MLPWSTVIIGSIELTILLKALNKDFSARKRSKGRFTFERIHNTKEQIYFYERAENHRAKERMFKSFK